MHLQLFPGSLREHRQLFLSLETPDALPKTPESPTERMESMEDVDRAVQARQESADQLWQGLQKLLESSLNKDAGLRLAITLPNGTRIEIGRRDGHQQPSAVPTPALGDPPHATASDRDSVIDDQLTVGEQADPQPAERSISPTPSRIDLKPMQKLPHIIRYSPEWIRKAFGGRDKAPTAPPVEAQKDAAPDVKRGASEALPDGPLQPPDASQLIGDLNQRTESRYTLREDGRIGLDFPASMQPAERQEVLDTLRSKGISDLLDTGTTVTFSPNVDWWNMTIRNNIKHQDPTAHMFVTDQRTGLITSRPGGAEF